MFQKLVLKFDGRATIAFVRPKVRLGLSCYQRTPHE